MSLNQRAFAFVLPFVFLTTNALAQSKASVDSEALSYASKSVRAMTNGNQIVDAVLTGNVVWSDSEPGTAILRASRTGKTRIDLMLPKGTRTEIRGGQDGALSGRSTDPNNNSGNIPSHNSWTDSAWFFPPLGSLAAGPNTVLTYVGQETRDDATVYHLQSYQQVSGSFRNPTPRQLSTMDFYLDSATLLPVAVTFNTHPDTNALINLPVEIRFSDYQDMNNVLVPTRIQRYQQGNLLMDLTITEASFNTGLSF